MGNKAASAMKPRALPSRWQSAQPALRAVQVAFDVSETVLQAVRQAAFDANLSNSDQIRVVLGLPVTRQPKRPRLTVSLSGDDYQLLGKRYKLDPADHLAIKERVNAQLMEFAEARVESNKPGKRVK
jgi:hypothetical protein